jgi:putative transposase
MAWKASSVMEEKLRFIYEYERDEETMRELCSRYGIARETGYVWLRRYRRQGAGGLVESDRAARHHPNQTPLEIEESVLELRQAHMRWGPRKLKRILGSGPAGARLAGGQHHRGDRQARRTGGGAQETT